MGTVAGGVPPTPALERGTDGREIVGPLRGSVDVAVGCRRVDAGGYRGADAGRRAAALTLGRWDEDAVGRRVEPETRLGEACDVEVGGEAPAKSAKAPSGDVVEGPPPPAAPPPPPPRLGAAAREAVWPETAVKRARASSGFMEVILRSRRMTAAARGNQRSTRENDQIGRAHV